MTDLPIHLLYVDPRKISDYLLAANHRQGRSKAHFFERLGFSPNRPEELAHALRELVLRADFYEVVASPFGIKYVVDGEIRGRQVRTIWMVKPPDRLIRLVSAYPVRRER